MSAARFFIIAITVLLGSLASCQASCENLWECHFVSKTQADCPVHQKSMDCLFRKFVDCEGKYSAMIRTKYNRHLSEQQICPGLPDGSCHFGVLNECEEMVKFYNRPHNCTLLETKYNDMEKCFEDMKKVCNTPRGLQMANRGMHRFLSHLKQCTDTQA